VLTDAGWVPALIPPPTKVPEMKYAVNMDRTEWMRIENDYPHLSKVLENLYLSGKLPSVNVAASREALDYDLRSAYYSLKGNKSASQQHPSGEPWAALFNKWHYKELAAYHEILRAKSPKTIKNLHTIVGNPTAFEHKWFPTVAATSWQYAARMFEDLRRYVQIASASYKMAQSFKRASQYPFETASWTDIVRDYHTLRSKFQQIHIRYDGTTQQPPTFIPSEEELYHDRYEPTPTGVTPRYNKFHHFRQSDMRTGIS
jgi:hypothetical protein